MQNSKSKMITTIQKRDGRNVAFNPNKVTQAMYRALMATHEVDGEKKSLAEAGRLTPIAIDLFARTVDGHPLHVETMQDVVEQVLMAAGHYKTAKAYILYRAQHKQARKVKEIIGVEDDLGLSLNQLKVMERRYLRHDEEGKVTESPRQLFERVARAIAANEKRERKSWEKQFLAMLTALEFVPGGAYLRSAGFERGMLANCFVLPVEDSMEGIFNAVKWMALVHQKGGGTGFNFSKLRPKGDYVTTSGGFSSGPISFMKVFDAATRQVMQGGFRKGANMGILNVNHPDIFNFISCKTEEHEVNNFNISVGASDIFMKAVDKNKEFDLVNQRTGEVVQTVSARALFDQIVTLAWRTGDPGMIYLDAINRTNPVIKTLGPMTATNPCGEQPLHPFDVCNLGSINLAKFVKASRLQSTDYGKKTVDLIDWRRLEEVTRLAVRFLDNGVDVSIYPIPQIANMAKANRRIGLGIMGWADMLYQLGIAYNSPLAYRLAQRVMQHINEAAHGESEKLAKEKGVFPNWKGSTYQKQGRKQRNVALTTIAPTGTISMVADCSSGIEPIFALSFVKNVVDEQGLIYVNPYFRQAVEQAVKDEAKRQEILDQVAKSGSCQNVSGIPKRVKEIFVTAHDISWEDHVRMQAAFQKHTDNAVSKTINFPNSTTIDEVGQAYLLAWKLGCKGITIYRDGSKSVQILSSHEQEEASAQPVIQSKVQIKPLRQRIRENGLGKQEVCPECGGLLQVSEGCSTCLECGYSKCSL
jgi:ribonucleoside-diphosphate reductase alpha chain